MGWTSYHATYYDKHGNIDRKKEMESGFYGGYDVLKSAMVGTTYYAAIRNPSGDIFAVVALTSTNKKDWYNFSCKLMDETEGPYESRCPKSILDLLPPTDNEYANKWRQRCRDNIGKPTNVQRLNALPVGTEIEFEIASGETKRYMKCPAGYQFKRPFWMNNERRYVPPKYIPSTFRVVTA